MEDLNRLPYIPPTRIDPADDKVWFVSTSATPGYDSLWWDHYTGPTPPNADRNQVLREMRAEEHALKHGGGQQLQPRMSQTALPAFVSQV